MAKDHFSTQSDQYRRFRPSYPQKLFHFLAEQSSRHNLAWDCATGNGQAALPLARYFRQVIATDLSPEQIKNGQPHPKVEYRVALAEKSGLADNSVDLITVAQALHWFDLPDFYREAGRAASSQALIAAWGYGEQKIERELDALILSYYRNIVGPFWPAERLHVETSYSNLAFPFEELKTPEFTIEVEMERHDFLGYLSSWSATRRFQEARGHSPLDHIEKEFVALWGAEKRRVVWPLFMRLGRLRRL